MLNNYSKMLRKIYFNSLTLHLYDLFLKGTVPPPTTSNSPDRRFFKHLSIIVPVVCAVVIVLVVIIVICVLHTRRNPPNRSRGHYDQGGKFMLYLHKWNTHSAICMCYNFVFRIAQQMRNLDHVINENSACSIISFSAHCHLRNQ